MLGFNEILLILVVHWLGDFPLQTEEQATGKSSRVKPLFWHVSVYSIVWLLMICATSEDLYIAVEFAFITFICHFVTDYITSRIGKPFWAKKDFHNGFVVVGFDQILHYIQLFLTYIYLLK